MSASSEDQAPVILQRAADIDAMPEAHIRHPWNENSDVFLKPLTRIAGLSRVSLTLARVPPGKESFVYHAHERDEEFVYILSGRGRAEIGDEVIDVGPGDFMAFQAPDGPAHHLTNPYDEDLVYLMGGEHSGYDIGRFPRLGRQIVFSGETIHAVDDDAMKPMTFADWMAKDD